MPTPSRKPVEVRLVPGGGRRKATPCGPGCVTLVGAGPGDPDLLTIKALKALQSAQIVLFDDLVGQGVLDLIHEQARCLAVGKRGGRESCDQGDINDLMVRFARAGKRVVRLKSGDPMIFGRAGEEIARLEAEGIAVEVIPGITSASAMAASARVSLTHRDHAQSVRFVTGHSRHGTLPDTLDWQGLADPHTSLVIYMGGRTAGDMVTRLMAAGLPAATPALAVRSVSRPEEMRWHGPLAALAAGVDTLGLDQPLLIGIGNAFANAAENSLAAACWGEDYSAALTPAAKARSSAATSGEEARANKAISDAGKGGRPSTGPRSGRPLAPAAPMGAMPIPARTPATRAATLPATKLSRQARPA